MAKLDRSTSLEHIQSVLPEDNTSAAHNGGESEKGQTRGRRDSTGLIHRQRVKSLEDITQSVTGHYITHKGSVRANFQPPEDSSFLSGVRAYLNKVGQSHRDYSLLIFHKKGKIRKSVKKVVKSKLFLVFIALTVLLNAVALCLYSPSIYDDDRRRNEVIAYISVIFIFVYLVEATLRIIAYGLILHPKAYLRNVRYILDILIILSGILYVSLQSSFPVAAEISASFMAFKLLRILALFKSVKFILKVLAMSVVPLFYLSVMTFCVMVFFALEGLELFIGELHGGCFASYTTPDGQLQSFRVSNFPCFRNRTGATGRSDSIPNGGHVCPGKSECAFWEEGPNFGITSFDGFGRALLTVFQVITLEGWTEVYYLYQSALGYSYTWVYFLLVIFLGSVFILNLWLGVLTSVFIGVSDRQETQFNIRRLKDEKRVEEDLANYREWMKRAVELDLPSETGSIGRRPSLSYGSTRIIGGRIELLRVEEDHSPSREVGEEVEENRKGFKYVCLRFHLKLRSLVRSLVESLVFSWFILGVLAINLLLLMTLHFPSDPKMDDAIYILNYIFTGVYIAEFILKFYALGLKVYFRSSLFNAADFVFTVVNVLDLLIFIHLNFRFMISIHVNAIRSIKLTRVFKSTRYWKAVKEIINTVRQLFAHMLSLLALIGLFLFVFTILGFRFFAERLSVSGYVRPNFDDLLNSFLVVYQLITTEDWNNVLYSSVNPWLHTPSGEFRSWGYLATIYFILAILIGALVLVQVFLALAVDKLSEVRALEEDTVKETEKRDEIRKAREEQIHALKNPEEPQVRRRTLRSAIKFYVDDPSQRTGAIPKSYWRQVSQPVPRKDAARKISSESPQTRAYLRSVSAPSESSNVNEEEVGKTDSAEAIPIQRRKLSNPLRLIRHRSDYFDQQKARLGGGLSTTSTHIREKSSSRSPPSVAPLASSDPPTVDDEDSVFAAHSPLWRTDSTVSSPHPISATAKQHGMGSMSYERSQSVPTWSPSGSAGGIFSPSSPLRMHALDTILEGSVAGITEEENPKAVRKEGEHDNISERQKRQYSHETSPEQIHPLSPSYLPTLGVDVSQRLGKQSSLEVIQPVSVEDLTRRRQSQVASPESHLRKKAKHVWEWVKEYFGTIQFDPKEELREIPNHSAFFILSPDNRLRQFCYKVVRSQTFQVITYAAILFSSIVLALEAPIPPASSGELCRLQDSIVYIDLILTTFFLIEMTLKMTVLGVFVHRGSYMRGFFNIIDFTVLVTNTVPLVVFFSKIDNGAEPQECTSYGFDSEILPTAVSAMRLLRVLRPLRAIRIPGLYLVVTGLISSVGSLAFIFFVMVLIIVIAAVGGTQLFRGAFFFCTDPMMKTEEDCSGSFFIYPSGDLSCPVVEERIWRRHGLHFDHIGSALLTLFAMLTGEGWNFVMYNGIDAVPPQDGIPRGPEIDHSRVSSLYFIVYMTIMTFVSVSIFVGFVIVTFQEVGVKSFRETKLDRNQRNCLYYALTAKPSFRYLPKYKAHEKLLEFVSHPFFKIAIVIALLLNSIALALQTNDSEEMSRAIYWINFAFTIFFALEATLKIIAFTPANYFRTIWNGFEFLIAVGSLVEVIVQRSVDSISEQYEYTHIVSAFRVLRLLHFIPHIRLIIWTVIQSLEIFPWVGVLLVVVVYSYAVIGMQVFGNIEIASIDESDETQIHQYNNFGNFPQALLVMIRVATGENWPDVMLSCTGGQPCYNSTERTCGSDFSYFFFPSFFFITSLLILNLFVAIIIDNFDYIVRDRSILGAHQLGLFVKLWSIYDPEAKGTLTPEQVVDLLRRCNPPVGWGKICPQTVAYRKMMKLNMPIIDGKVTFNATLFALVRTSLKVGCEGCDNCLHSCNEDLKGKLKMLFLRVPQKRLDEVMPEGAVHTVRKEYAAHLMQDVWRNYMLRRKRTLQMFQGSQGRVLKAGLRRLPDAGPDLKARKVSDFGLDLAPFSMPRKESDSSDEGVVALLESVTSFVKVAFLPGIHSVNNDQAHGQSSHAVRQSRPELTEDVEDHSSAAQGFESEADTHSELSFASAYSSLVGSEEVLHEQQHNVLVEFEDNYQLLETSV